MLRFAVVTDIHYGFDQGNKKGAQAPRLVDRFVRVANQNRVDFSVDLGDRVIFKTPEMDRHYLGKLKDHFNLLAAPHHSVHGNHDLGNLTREENAALLGVPAHSYSFDHGGHHFILFNPNVRPDANRQLLLDEADIKWLEDDLAGTPYRSVLFSHIPLDNTARDARTHKEGEPWVFPSFYEAQGHQVRAVLEDSGKVILCMAGHHHRNRHQHINDIHYITHQSLIQRNERTGHARGAFSIVGIEDDRILIKGYGVGQKTRILTLNEP